MMIEMMKLKKAAKKSSVGKGTHHLYFFNDIIKGQTGTTACCV